MWRSLPRIATGPCIWALDFNVDPMCSIIAQRVDGKMRVLDEIFLRGATTYESAVTGLPSEKFPRHTAEVTVYGDASGYQHQTTGSTDYEMIREYFAVNTKMPVRYGREVQSAHSRQGQSDERDITLSRRRYSGGGGPEMQGTGKGPGTSVLQRR